LEDAGNLGLVLNDLQNRPEVKQRLVMSLRAFYESVTDVTTKIQGGTVQIFFHEEGLKHPVPATRLSDGTLRYLCLLAILCHPEPPPVVCIEEPELGLHPDAIPEVANMLVEASRQCQLFVTTHSDILVDALTATPEAVIVCEKVDGASQLRRLDAEKLKPWLAKYRLGDLWTRGEIGGTRW
jgi:predicted ATPase